MDLSWIVTRKSRHAVIVAALTLDSGWWTGTVREESGCQSWEAEVGFPGGGLRDGVGKGKGVEGRKKRDSEVCKKGLFGDGPRASTPARPTHQALISPCRPPAGTSFWLVFLFAAAQANAPTCTHSVLPLGYQRTVVHLAFLHPASHNLVVLCSRSPLNLFVSSNSHQRLLTWLNARQLVLLLSLILLEKFGTYVNPPAIYSTLPQPTRERYLSCRPLEPALDTFTTSPGLGACWMYLHVAKATNVDCTVANSSMP